MPKIPVKVVTWEDIVVLAEKLSEIIKNSYSPDVIIAVARGGLVPARLLADSLGVVDVLSLKVEHWITTANHTTEARIKYPYKVDLNDKKVLIIDDITDTGDSLILTSSYVKENFSPYSMKTATLQHIKTSSKFVPDYYAQEITEWAWFMYPWNYWEDEINLVRKIIDEKKSKDLEVLKERFREDYGVDPPVPLVKILEEMRRRKIF
ncbi:phosphoribosyltransferase [Metallosphaera tengchongensis]|uniref:Phosphoribosyltransferase n=1 Tax=Metallosphaera tengchongensis TaxID=1532350 RepID=A0A6N0NU22_9CREN|nr:phosphoribosyltransferase [Metallosphaera tengchongensis]QKR00384.1 phosphoribosyltransferase [Metallosphaera tengchongensis]